MKYILPKRVRDGGRDTEPSETTGAGVIRTLEKFRSEQKPLSPELFNYTTSDVTSNVFFCILLIYVFCPDCFFDAEKRYLRNPIIASSSTRMLFLSARERELCECILVGGRGYELSNLTDRNVYTIVGFGNGWIDLPQRARKN